MIADKLKRIEELAVQNNMPVDPAAIENAKAITAMLCALEVKHYIYPTPEKGIQFEFETEHPIELEINATGRMELTNFYIPKGYDPSGEASLCQCANPISPHTCPYKEDVNNDHETLCTCCSACQHECMMDI